MPAATLNVIPDQTRIIVHNANNGFIIDNPITNTLTISSSTNLLKVKNDTVNILSIVSQGPRGVDGRDGVDGLDGTGDKNYVHVQLSAAMVWNIPHNLSKRPAVSIVDSSETQVSGYVHYIDDNNVQLQFSAPFGGKAYLN